MKLSATPTVIPPKLYSERFMQAMKHYFLRISSDWVITATEFKLVSMADTKNSL